MTDRLSDGIYFLKEKDALAILLNHKARELYLTLQNFDASSLDIADSFKDYFINHHLGNRLFFSIQNSAHILYQSVKKTGKATDEINITDYGAGLGTLYMLAGMLQFKKVVYNDYLPDWKDTAAAVCEALNIDIDGYVTGDIDAVMDYAVKEGFTFDIIASRNVIEHIYSLPIFFETVYRHNPSAVVFSTTSANFHNPAMRFKHYLVHKKIERTQYLPYRKKALQKEWPAITGNQLKELSLLTRGKAKEDFLIAITDYKNNSTVSKVPFLRSNTCLPDSGYWCEHLLSKNEYKSIINKAGFDLEYTAGYWDTNYASPLMNLIGNFFNKLIGLFGKNGYFFSPFVNVVAFKNIELKK
jgi:2-polyprenyl-3-methyl-5-hydroxy-6-metoxy-1,4-benzoquinol methylase